MPKQVKARAAQDEQEARTVRKLAKSYHAPADWKFHAQMVVGSWVGKTMVARDEEGSAKFRLDALPRATPRTTLPCWLLSKPTIRRATSSPTTSPVTTVPRPALGWSSIRASITSSFPTFACWLDLQAGWGRLFRRDPLAGQSFANPDEIEQATRVATSQLNRRAKSWV